MSEYKYNLYETKFDKETRTFTGWRIEFENEKKNIINTFYQYRLIFSEDYQRI